MLRIQIALAWQRLTDFNYYWCNSTEGNNCVYVTLSTDVSFLLMTWVCLQITVITFKQVAMQLVVHSISIDGEMNTRCFLAVPIVCSVLPAKMKNAQTLMTFVLCLRSEIICLCTTSLIVRISKFLCLSLGLYCLAATLNCNQMRCGRSEDKACYRHGSPAWVSVNLSVSSLKTWDFFVKRRK